MYEVKIMKFTIVIVTYNSKWEKLKLTLDSIINQDFNDYEIIISDDGSKYNNFDEIDIYMKKNEFEKYKLIKHEKNVGTVKNLLSAVEAASGKYIRDFGPGDLFYNEKSLGRLYDFMEREQCEACFGLVRGYYNDNQNKNRTVNFYHPFDLNAYKRQDNKKIKRNLVLFRDYPPGSCTSYTRNVYLHYLRLLSERIIYTEDIFQILAAFDGVFFKFMPEYIIWYETEEGVSNSAGIYSKRMIDDVEEFYKYLYEEYGDDKYVKKQKKVFKLYKISNLYIRTLVRFVINPSAITYLINHFWQTKTSIYKPLHEEKGFLDEQI